MDVSLKAIKTNLRTVTLGDVTVWFSYETPIAVLAPALGTVVRQNEWTGITGGHMSLIDGGTAEARKKRVSKEAFDMSLRQALGMIAYSL